MLNRIASFLKIRQDEGRLAVLIAILFACIQAGQGLGENAASALFFLRFGVDYLPYMYLAAGALTFVITMAYSAGLGRFEKGVFFQWVIAAFVFLLVIERAAILMTFPFLYPALWLTINCIGGILGTFVWNLAGEVCDARQAKRLFPFFVSAGILGSVAGNAITGIFAEQFGTENLLLFYAGLLALAFYLTRNISRSYFQKQKTFGNATSLWDDLRAGFDFVRVSPLMVLVAVSSVFFSVLFFTVAFPFSKIVTASFPDEAGVAGFFGFFNSITTVSTFLISLFLANRIYARLGIINAVFLMPLTYIFCFGVFAFRYDLGGAAVAHFAQLVILSGVAGTAWNALFNVVPSQKRGQVLAFNNGVPSQIGVALSGILLIVADKVFTIQQIFLMGALLALVCCMLVWRMRRAYAQALIDALRAGRLEVFSSSETTFSGLQNDAAALQVILRALQDSKTMTRQLASEMLGKMQARSAIPALTRLLSDPEPDVRASAISSLGVLRAEPALDEIIAHLADPSEKVRAQVISAIAQLSRNIPTNLIEKFDGILNDDPSVPVRIKTAFAMVGLGLSERVLPHLRMWLNSQDSQMRVAALNMMGASAETSRLASDTQSLLTALEDPSAVIRKAAALALANFAGAIIDRALIAHLSDPDESVSSAAAESLRQRGDECQKFVLKIFESDSPAIDAALDALAPENPELLAPLRLFAGREIVRARGLRNQFASLPTSGRSVQFLRDRLHVQVSVSEERLIKTIGLFGNMRAMELVRKSMQGANAENRAAALEALDTIGDQQLAKNILNLLEEEPTQSSPSDVIGTLLKNIDPWLRILAVCSMPELNLREYIPVLRALKSDPDALIRDAALRSLAQFGEVEAMDTLKTVSMIERILLLREVPIFAGLSPEDLKHVAERAREEWYPGGTAIFHEGDEGNILFIIVEGRVDIIRKIDGINKVLAERDAWDFIGEMAIIESARRSATVISKSEVRMLVIDDLTFKGILRERPDVSFAVLRSISRRLREREA